MAQVAEILLFDAKTSRHYFERYQKGGFQALLDDRYSRTRFMFLWQESVVRYWLIFILVLAAVGTSVGEPIEFGDVRLKAAVELAVGKVDPNAADMLRLTKLVAPSVRISSLSGLEYALNLGSLRLTNNCVRDISPLSEMRKLAFLDLSSNAIEDVGPLLRLARLRHLNLSYNEISDISAICNLTELEVVRFSDNRISKIPDMVGFVRLGELDLSRNRLSNISGLTWLKSLSRLKLEGNPVNRSAYRRDIPLITKRNGGLHNERRRRTPRWIRRLSPRLAKLLPWYKGTAIVPNGKFTYDADSNYWLEAGIALCLVAYITVRLLWRRRRRKAEAVKKFNR